LCKVFKENTRQRGKEMKPLTAAELDDIVGKLVTIRLAIDLTRQSTVKRPIYWANIQADLAELDEKYGKGGK